MKKTNIKLFLDIIVLVGMGLFFGFLWGSSESFFQHGVVGVAKKAPSP